VTQTHVVLAEELNLGDTSTGDEFLGAVIFVKIHNGRVQVFTDLERKPDEEGYEISPHYGWILELGQEIELNTEASEDARALWMSADFEAVEYGQRVDLAHRAAVARQRTQKS
jgi:hypothetical protein